MERGLGDRKRAPVCPHLCACSRGEGVRLCHVHTAWLRDLQVDPAGSVCIFHCGLGTESGPCVYEGSAGSPGGWTLGLLAVITQGEGHRRADGRGPQMTSGCWNQHIMVGGSCGDLLTSGPSATPSGEVAAYSPEKHWL